MHDASWRRRRRTETIPTVRRINQIQMLKMVAESMTYFALILSCAIALDNVNCTPSVSFAGSQSSDKVVLVRSGAPRTSGNVRSEGGFSEKFDNLLIHVKENTPIGSRLTDIPTPEQHASGDQVLYSLVGGPDKYNFTLRVSNDNSKVELVNEVAFDYESQKRSYQIVVRTINAFMRFDITVDINIIDENDNKPQLEDFTVVFNNYKNNFPNTPIGRVPATDADESDQLRYRVLAGNNAEYVLVNETTGDIQLSPWLNNNNVAHKAIISVEVTDGTHEATAQMVLVANLITEQMLQNSVVLSLVGITREEFLTSKYDRFIEAMAHHLAPTGMYATSNIVVFNVEDASLKVPLSDAPIIYRSYHSVTSHNMTHSVNVSFSARLDNNGVESYLSRQHIEERIYSDRLQLMQELDLYIAPFEDNLCVQEPCQNYQECQATYKFDKAPKSFLTTRNMIFRQVLAVQSYACSCPPTFTGMKHKSECNLQINQCFSNPCLNGGICHRHESGYSCECKGDHFGQKCEHSFTNSTCQSISMPTSNLLLDYRTQLQSTVCGGKSKCVNSNKPHYISTKPTAITSPSGGFSCQGCLYPQWSNELCQLRARSFTRNSYITLPSLRRRHRFHIGLRFATIHNDGLLLYNGRYNDKHDFIALEIVDSKLRFSYSLGASVTSLSLNSISVSDGRWHRVAIDYKDRNVTLLIDDCDPVIDEALAKLQLQSRRCSNTSYSDPSTATSEFRALDLNSPMHLGSTPSANAEFQTSSSAPISSYVGCMSDIYFDHQLVDLYSPIKDAGTQLGCQEKRNFCQANACNDHPCQDVWGAASCYCGEDHVGKSCEIPISNEKVRRFNGHSYMTFSPVESQITSTWQISLYFRTINPIGTLMKVSLDPEATISLELLNGGLRLSHRIHNMTYNKNQLDDGEWHHVELVWSNEFVQLSIDHNSNLSVQSNDMGTILGSVIKAITLGAAPTRLSAIVPPPPSASPDSQDFSSSVASMSPEEYSNMYSTLTSNVSIQSFVGCIFGMNVSGNTEMWLAPNEDRNVERGCQTIDVCDTNPCPPNSKCVRRGMNQRECICEPGFVGDRCVPVCSLNPCQGDNSKCLPVNAQQSDTATSSASNDARTSFNPQGTSYVCECEPHRSGKNCEYQLSARCPSNWWGRPFAGSGSSMCGPCNCDESRGFDGDCDKLTGQCFCKPNHYQVAGSDYCLPCDCYTIGSLSATCNQTTGQCKCQPGVVGRRCDTCASNYAEVTRRGCEVIYDACPKTYSDGIWWDQTELGKNITQPCPVSTSTGFATRFCHKSEGWQKPNMFECISNTFTDLYNRYKFIEENKVALNSPSKIAADLKQALNETISSPTMQLYGGDMYISFRLLHHLIQHETRQVGLNLTHRQDRMYIRNIAESINYLLDPAFADNWPEIAARSPNGGAEHLLRLIDSYGKVMIESQLDTFTRPFEITTKYFTLGMETLSIDQTWDMSKSTTSINGAASSPPYATDPFGAGISNTIDHASSSGHYSMDGVSQISDYSTNKDGSPAAVVPKSESFAFDAGVDDDITKAVIPLKALKVKTPQDVMSSPYFQARSRARRDALLGPELKLERQQPAVIVYSIYRSLGALLPNNSDNTVQHRLDMLATANSPVVWLTVRPANSSEFLGKNIQPKITYVLKMVESTGRTRPQCAVWDFANTGSNKAISGYGIKQTGRYTTKGCEIKAIHPNHRLRRYDYVNCSCDHLGAVTVLMDSANYEYLTSEETSSKDFIQSVSLGVSLIILASIILILGCVRGHSNKSNSNSINKNLIFILIVIESLILYTMIAKSSLTQREYQCKLVAIFLHYFSISLFFWLLVNAIHFYRMLTELKDINHGPMKFYHVLGYAVPAFFVSIAVGLRIEHFGSYMFCWLSIHEPIIWSMFGPVCALSCAIIVLYTLALCKSIPASDDQLNGSELLKNHMLINIVKTPLVAIYWLITVYVVNEALVDSLFLFPIVAVAKSIALFVLLCIIDRHIRYNLYVSWLRFNGQKVPYADEAANYASCQWIPEMMGEQGNFNKHHSYTNYNGPITTPGFQSSCTDIFRPDVLAFSAASTTSRSTATGTSSSAYNQYHQHHVKGADANKDPSGYGRAGKRHRRKHKKSHHKHHHHRHHHHHHHHRSHRHDHDEYEVHYDRNDKRRHAHQVRQLHNETNNAHELASSISSDDAESTAQRNSMVGETSKDTNQATYNVNQGASTSSVPNKPLGLENRALKTDVLNDTELDNQQSLNAGSEPAEVRLDTGPTGQPNDAELSNFFTQPKE